MSYSVISSGTLSFNFLTIAARPICNIKISQFFWWNLTQTDHSLHFHTIHFKNNVYCVRMEKILSILNL